ncbi:unnamed protein product [Rotaria sordida]|uniref:NACHT domain-containing protein n=1 Tax=Rotaria sordida TaxID=392033 RepID=A0A815I0N2_9BILA|nr:unnamed protein product [Rotaria sordida]CAF1361502.1 unnamed protein product [Rotaria sordida]CAF1361659.1 unnamed protein product [Rotaria sordida]
MGKALVDESHISLDCLSNALNDYIKQGQALIILDGLDEIPVSEQRSKIINLVENFVENYVQTSTGISVFDNPHMNRVFDDPFRLGGNQLIVTSRIVGYHAAPLDGQFAHYTIRPMDEEHMKDFVDYWFFNVHKQILETLELSMDNQGERHGEALKEELEKLENIGLRDVASNSCLMSFICTVSFQQAEDSSLPTQRILLYEQIVRSMLSLWSTKGTTIHIPKLTRILSDIATHIHQNSASGLIHEEKMKEVCVESLKVFLNKKVYTEEDIRAIEKQASEFVRIFREDVGILAARGESLYGFLHLTFQEYFTCLKLIDVDKLKQEKMATHSLCSEGKVQLIVQSLRRHMNNPRFRVPIALALEQDLSNSLLPLGAYIFIISANDLVNYPSDNVLCDALDQLMIAAGQYQWIFAWKRN